jgi:hypothetical protein
MVFALTVISVNGAIAEIDAFVAVAERECHGVADVACRSNSWHIRGGWLRPSRRSGGVTVADRLKLGQPTTGITLPP